MKFPFFAVGVMVVFGVAFLLGCSDGVEETDLDPEALRFEIVRINEGELVVEARALAAGSTARSRLPEGGTTFHLLLSRGDAAYLETGDVCLGQLGESSEGAFRIHEVWPDGSVLRDKLEQTNATLRREVERRGENVAREVGSILPEFAVIDQDGELIDASFFKGKITLINFFFTRCSNPSMCPATTRRLKQLLEKASADGLSDLQVLSLSFDPEHDAPGFLKDYAAAYQLDESRFRLGTGPRQVMDDLRRLLGIATRKDPQLVIDHTFRAVLVDERRFIAAEILGSAWSMENALAQIKFLGQEGGQ